MSYSYYYLVIIVTLYIKVFPFLLSIYSYKLSKLNSNKSDTFIKRLFNIIEFILLLLIRNSYFHYYYSYYYLIITVTLLIKDCLHSY